MPNPLDYVTKQDILDLGLSPEELSTSYQPSSGGVYHARGAEGTGKTLWIAHFYRHLIDSGKFTPYDTVANLTFKGKYGQGLTTLKGQELFDYLLNFSRTLPKHRIVIVSEIDREFPARFFSSKEQTEIALTMWEVQKIDSYFLLDSHIGNSTDLIFHLGSHYLILPEKPDFETNTMNFTFINNLELWTDDFTAHDVIKTMLIYNRCETTVVSSHNDKKKTQQIEKSTELDIDTELDLSAELETLNF
jgi:hypothetical protein